MPVYEYACEHKRCKQSKEILHSYAEIKEPSADTLQEMQCPKGHGCMTRVFSAPHLANMKGGVSVSESVLLQEKQKQRKIRSRLQFKNDVLPTLKAGEKRHFEKKLKHLKGDHEKIK